MYKVYQVQSGETIDNLSQRLGIRSQDLIDMNGLTGPITPGQLLVIPNQNSMFDTYTVVKGDNMYEIARRYNIDYNNLLKLNGLDKDDFIYPNQQILIPKNDISVYVTDENETLNDVANKLGVTVMDLINQNETIYLIPDQLITYRR